MNGHFARCQASPRKVYFTNRMSRADLRKRVLEWKTRRDFILRIERDSDRELQARIRQSNRDHRKPIVPANSPLE
jgi:hypothetical protein